MQASDWTERQPKSLADALWYQVPTPLSDEPANLQMPDTPFREDDVTITAVVPLATPAPGRSREPVLSRDVDRLSYLPDDAAGTFAPGWDVARDWLTDTTEHLANYGLGSPFPEDAKLCAALSAFWPAVAPDATREFAFAESAQYRTVVPLTDDEIGTGSGAPWDGVPPPRLVRRAGKMYAEYASFTHSDYALSAVANRFTLSATGYISEREYQERALAMATAFRALSAKMKLRYRWVVLSYRSVAASDPERRAAERATGVEIPGAAHRFEMFRGRKPTRSRKAPFKQRMLVRDRTTLFIDAESGIVLMRRGGKWTRKSVTWG